MANETLKAGFDKYMAGVEAKLAKNPERANLEPNRLYTPLDIEGFDYEKDLGFPGEYPYTRGVQPTMYRGRFWTMRMYAGFSTAEESNKRYRYLLANGGSGLSMTINAPASVLLCMYIAVAEKQGVSADKLRGTIQNDILKEYAARGTYIFPPKPSMRLITNIFEYCSKNVPLWNTISISGYHIREAGSTASQEIAFTIADGIAYVEAAIKAGMNVDDFAGRLSFFWNAHNNVLEEVAKFRASRRVWAKVMKERFGAQKPKSQMLRVHTQTAGSMLTAQQPNNNIVRVALQTAAAVMGGTQSLHTNSKDEALALPTTESVTIALRTQQIVAYESGLADTVDPLGGSYYVEALTNKIEAEAWEYIKKIDEIGGAPEAIAKGYIQKEIQDSAYKWQMDIEKGDRIIVGVNKFQQEEEPPKNLLRVDGSVGKLQADKIAALKARRDNAKVEETLAALEKGCADESVNLMPLILDAVRAYATEGEICGVMRKVFGEYQSHTAL